MFSTPYRRRIAYFMDPEIGNFYFGQNHPMKPYRLAITHNFVLNYGLDNYMQFYKPHRATVEELKAFHSSDYIDYLYR